MFRIYCRACNLIFLYSYDFFHVLLGYLIKRWGYQKLLSYFFLIILCIIKPGKFIWPSIKLLIIIYGSLTTHQIINFYKMLFYVHDFDIDYKKFLMQLVNMFLAHIKTLKYADCISYE